MHGASLATSVAGGGGTINDGTDDNTELCMYVYMCSLFKYSSLNEAIASYNDEFP